MWDGRCGDRKGLAWSWLAGIFTPKRDFPPWHVHALLGHLGLLSIVLVVCARVTLCLQHHSPVQPRLSISLSDHPRRLGVITVMIFFFPTSCTLDEGQEKSPNCKVDWYATMKFSESMHIHASDLAFTCFVSWNCYCIVCTWIKAQERMYKLGTPAATRRSQDEPYRISRRWLARLYAHATERW